MWRERSGGRGLNESASKHFHKERQVADSAPPPICGIVMPISAIDSCTAEHWRDVKAILYEAIEESGHSPQLVSDAEEVGIIQKRIIQNLYENPIVVVDVSAKNPNVMFELGMRLAFDRPTVIVKDDKTSYSFDTSPVEHLTYPRDLRFGQIVDFKEALAEKIRATCQRAKDDPQYTTFLKHFGTFKDRRSQDRGGSARSVDSGRGSKPPGDSHKTGVGLQARRFWRLKCCAEPYALSWSTSRRGCGRCLLATP